MIENMDEPQICRGEKSQAGIAGKLKKMSALDYGFYLLGLQGNTRAQLEVKLGKKGFEKGDISKAMDRLEELGYLNDAKFAQEYFQNLIKYKQLGYFGIKKKLTGKMLPPAEIEKMLKTYSIKDELAQAQQLIERKSRALGKTTKKTSGDAREQRLIIQKEKARLARALASRGFRAEVISKILHS